DRDMTAQPASRRAGVAAPGAPVDPAHQDVVAVSGLEPDADPRRRRRHRVDDAPAASRELPAASQETQGQIGVLPICAPEALVEAAGCLERGKAEGHICSGPARSLETCDVPL